MGKYPIYSHNHYHHYHNFEKPSRVFIDTDAGIDDGIALFIFLVAEALGLVRIEGITLGSGNTDVDTGAVNMLRILEAAHRTDIPVYKGVNSTLIPPEFVGAPFFGTDGFGDLNWNSEPDTSLVMPELAPFILGKTVVENPGEISVIGLGPPTNIGVAQKLFPSFLKDVKSIFLVGGTYKAIGNVRPTADYNFYMDPEAAHIILNGTNKLVNLLTWESVLKTTISNEWRYTTLGSIKNPVLEILERAEQTVYGPKTEFWNPADAMGAAAFLYPETMIRRDEVLPATIELHGWETRGQLVIDHNNSTIPNTRIIEKLDQKFFMNLMIYAAQETKNSFEPMYKTAKKYP